MAEPLLLLGAPGQYRHYGKTIIVHTICRLCFSAAQTH
jgi:transposase-like protein